MQENQCTASKSFSASVKLRYQTFTRNYFPWLNRPGTFVPNISESNLVSLLTQLRHLYP